MTMFKIMISNYITVLQYTASPDTLFSLLIIYISFLFLIKVQSSVRIYIKIYEKIRMEIQSHSTEIQPIPKKEKSVYGNMLYII